MAYDDTLFSRSGRYSIGVERDPGRYYLSIPVSNGVLDYEEHYLRDPDRYETFLKDKEAAVAFAESCRRHERADLLNESPGSNPRYTV